MANGNGNGLTSDLTIDPDLLPGSVSNQLAFGTRGQAPAAAAAAPPHIDLALGDSIAAQQLHHKVGGLATPKMYNGNNPAPIDYSKNPYTAEVGAPPSRIKARIADMLKNNPDAVKGKTVFLGIGSNQSDTPGEFDTIPSVLSMLHDAGVGKVLMPGLGPGVANNQALNVQLGKDATAAGPEFTFFQPNIAWTVRQDGGIHPQNGADMQREAIAAMGVGAPTSLLPPAAPGQEPSALAPVPTTSLQYPDITVPVGGYQRTSGTAPGADLDSGMIAGTQIPISVGKQFIRHFEAGAAGYRSAWGLPQGLPQNVDVDQYGFPTQAAYAGAPVGGLYGGRYGAAKSHAAGMFQFQPATWQEGVQGLRAEGVNITDFSPASQERVATWFLQNKGMGDWLPYNSPLRASWNQYLKSGQMPELAQPADYAGGTGGTQAGGPYMSGDVVPGTGYAVGGAAAFLPQPTPNQLAPGATTVASTTTPPTTTAAPAPSGGTTPAGWTPNLPPVDTSQGGLGSLLDNPQYRQAMMLQILGAQMRGIKIQPVDYNPEWAAKPSPVSPVYAMNPSAGPLAIHAPGNAPEGIAPPQIVMPQVPIKSESKLYE